MKKNFFISRYFFLIIVFIFFCFFQVKNLANAQGGPSMNPNYSMWGYDRYGRPLNYKGEPIDSQEKKEEECGFFGWRCIATGVMVKLGGMLVEALAFIIKFAGWGIHYIITYLNLHVFAPLADFTLSLDPFNINGRSPTEQLWFIIKTFAYIILTFSALFAGFQWILGEDNSAKSLIFNIIVVALFIDFVYLFIKEAFYVVRAIENGISGEVVLQKADGTAETRAGTSALGSLLAAAAWSQSPLNDIDRIVKESSRLARDTSKQYQTDVISDNLEKEFEAIRNSFIAIAVSIFYVTFAMIIFTMLIVLIALGFARYLILIFLTGVSSFAVATLAFPQFKPPFNEITSMVSGVFSVWLKHVAAWLLVVPVFGIMLILGVMLQKNFMEATQNIPNMTGVIQFIISLMFILGWFLLSVRIASEMSNKVALMAQGFAFNVLKYVGRLATEGLTRGFAGSAGSFMERIGKGLSKRAGTGWLGRRFHNLSKFALRTSEGLKQTAFGKNAEIFADKLKATTAQLEKAKTNEEKKKATQSLMGIINEMKRQPEVVRFNKEAIKQISSHALQKIADDKELLQEFMTTISDLDTETQEGIISRLDKLSAAKILEYMKDGNFAKLIGGLSDVILNSLANKISEIDPQDVISLLQDDSFRNSLANNAEELGPIIGALNRATKGLYNGLVKKDVEEVGDALARLPSEVFRKGGSLIDLINREMPGSINQILARVISINGTEFFNGFKRAFSDERQKMTNALDNFFRGNVDFLTSMVSEEEISFLRMFLRDPSMGKEAKDFYDQSLSHEQRSLLGMPQKSDQTQEKKIIIARG